MKQVDVFIPCCIDQHKPEIGHDFIALLQMMGFQANYNENQTCCSKHLYENGNWTEATKVGEKFLEDFKGENTIVTCSTACVSYIKNHFGNLFHNTSYHNDYNSIARRIMDISQFIYSQRPDCDLGAQFYHKVYFHSNCQARNLYNVDEECKLILGKVKGLDLVNKQDCDNNCCGFGGGLFYHNPLVSEELAKKKVQKAIDLGAEYICSTDYTCLMQMESYIRKSKANIKVIHLVSLLMDSKKTVTD